MMSLNYALQNVSCTVVVVLIFLETVSQDCSYRNSLLSHLPIAGCDIGVQLSVCPSVNNLRRVKYYKFSSLNL